MFTSPAVRLSASVEKTTSPKSETDGTLTMPPLPGVLPPSGVLTIVISPVSQSAR